MSQHRRGSIHAAGSSPVPGGHPNAASSSSSSSHEIQTRGIPLPGMVPSRSIHGNPMHGNPIHGFVNPLGPAGLVHSPPTHQPLLSGISHHSSVVHQGSSGHTRPFAFVREDRRRRDRDLEEREERGSIVAGLVPFRDVSIAFPVFREHDDDIRNDLGERTDIAARLAWKVEQWWSCGGMENLIIESGDGTSYEEWIKSERSGTCVRAKNRGRGRETGFLYEMSIFPFSPLSFFSFFLSSFLEKNPRTKFHRAFSTRFLFSSTRNYTASNFSQPDVFHPLGQEIE